MLQPKGKKLQPKVTIATVPPSIEPVASTTGDSSSKPEETTHNPPSLPSTEKTNKHNRTKTPATISIDRKLANEQTESSMPLIDIIWESLAGSALSSEAGTKHLSVNEMRILGEAMCGHVVTTESCIHQIHRCRATLAVAQINDLFVQKFAGSLQSLIRNKSFSREETTQVRDFVNTRLREIIMKWIRAMYPSAELESFRKGLQLKIENFYAELPSGKGSKSAKKLKGWLRKSRETDGSNSINADRLSLEIHVLNKFFMDPKTITNIAKMNTQHFFLTEAQFQSFAQSDLIGMTRMSPALSSDPNAIVTFLTVLLERIWLLQKRLNLIQQHALTAIFDKRLQDINYNFSVDVRTKQAMQPDRKQKVVRDAVHDRVKPMDIEWKFIDGKWIMVDQETLAG